MERERIFGILAKIEATSGTDSIPTAAANALRVVGIPILQLADLETGDRSDVQSGVMITPDRAASAGRYGKIDIQLEVKGGGDAGVEPEADVLLLGSGMSKTIVADTSVLYTTIDTAMPTFTLYCYSASKLFKLVGCVATLKLSADAAKRGMMTFSVTGKLGAAPTQVSLPTLTVSSVIPPLFVAAAASIGTWTSGDADPLVLKTVSLDLANVISERPSAGAADGLVGYSITDRKTTQSMTVEVPQLATFDAFALSKATGDTMPVSAWQIGTVVGNRVKIATGPWSIGLPKQAAANAISTYALDGTLGAGASGAATRELALLWD